MTPEAILIENMLTIADKSGEDVPFRLNSTQRTLDENLSGRDIVPKARQEGVSSYCLGRGTIKCLTKRNTKAVVISHEAKATERMLSKVHYFLENLKPAPVIGHSSKNTITFPKMDSMFYIGTAGSSEFGRGDTISFLHCSEIAFWENAKTLMTGLMQAVPEGSGEVILESTGNGQGNYYHKAVQACVAGRSHYKLHFFDWLSFPEYDLPVSPNEASEILGNLDADLGEVELVEKWGLTAGQIKFRRHKLVELEYDLTKFDQEYPKTLDECFQASGSGIFSKVIFVESDDWNSIGHRLDGLHYHPIAGKRYGIGADVGAGVGQDRSIAEIFDLDTMEQVAEYWSDQESPDEFGETLAQLGEQYNGAFITVEANNYGITTLDHLTRTDNDGNPRYPIDMVYAEDKGQARGANEPQILTSLGFRTTHVSKPWLVGKLRSSLATAMVIHSPELKGELSTFVEKDGGKLEAEDGCFDDRVIATGMVEVGRMRALAALAPPPTSRIEVVDPFSLDAAIKELRARGRNFPIPSQVA